MIQNPGSPEMFSPELIRHRASEAKGGQSHCGKMSLLHPLNAASSLCGRAMGMYVRRAEVDKLMLDLR